MAYQQMLIYFRNNFLILLVYKKTCFNPASIENSFKLLVTFDATYVTVGNSR